MKAYAIVIKGNKVSMDGYDALVESSKSVGNNFEIENYLATTPEFADVTLKGNGLKWTYPWEGRTIDFASGLTLSAYPTTYRERRIACFMSHFRLWHECKKINEPIIVFEHDAIFVHKLDPEPIINSKYDVIGINNPLMATRKAQLYHKMVKENNEEIQPVPYN